MSGPDARGVLSEGGKAQEGKKYWVLLLFLREKLFIFLFPPGNLTVTVEF